MSFGEESGLEQGKQNFKYNGKELDKEHGLNQYDYAARFMDPSMIRFTSVDPLAEKYYSWSPYVYVMNNPLKYIDPDGRQSNPYTQLNTLNKQEHNIIKNSYGGLVNAAFVKNNAEKATKATVKIFGSNGKGNQSDAFRHAYWKLLILRMSVSNLQRILVMPMNIQLPQMN